MTITITKYYYYKYAIFIAMKKEILILSVAMKNFLPPSKHHPKLMYCFLPFSLWKPVLSFRIFLVQTVFF